MPIKFPKTTAAYEFETPYDRMNRLNRNSEAAQARKDAQAAAIRKVAPGAPYYQPHSFDTDEEAIARAKAQGEYIQRNSNAGKRWQQDEGIFAPGMRAINAHIQGKRGIDVLNAANNPELLQGAEKAGRDAVAPMHRERYNELKREERRTSPGMKKGGKVSASSRADGIAQRGKTRGKML